MVLAYRSSEHGSFSYPSVLDNFTKQLSVDGTEVELSVWDTYGQPEATRLQLFVGTDVDIFLVVFSVAIHWKNYLNVKKL